MTDDHERVQEILAAAALHALDKEQQAEAQDVLSVHLPECTECRRAQDDFEQVVAELALATPPRHPPRLLGTRLRREVRKGHRPTRMPIAMAAVAVALVAGLGVWNTHLATRVSRAEHRQAATQANTAELIYAVSHPQSRVVSFDAPSAGAGSTAASAAQIAATYVPGRAVMYLFGSMPEPADGNVYQVWLGRSGSYSSAGTFVPESEGLVFVRIPVDATSYDTVMVTEEPVRGSTAPSERQVVSATL